MHPRVRHAAGQRLEGDGGHLQQGACHVLALCLQPWSAESHILLGTESSCFMTDRWVGMY